MSDPPEGLESAFKKYHIYIIHKHFSINLKSYIYYDGIKKKLANLQITLHRVKSRLISVKGV